MQNHNLKLAVFIFLLGIFMIPSCTDKDDIPAMNACPSCGLEPMVGPCNAAFPRYYFDKTEEKCKVFTWGGCNGVVPFETLEECELCECTG